MRNFFFSGHRDFGNRGCEAIIRSTVAIIKQAIPEATFSVPSTDVERDQALWPDAPDCKVHFHSCLHQSLIMRAYGKARKRIDQLCNSYPVIAPPKESRWLIDAADAVLSVGGDNYSEDYSLPYLPLLLDDYAISKGKPVVLWGASVGPFERSEVYRQFMSQHMRRYTAVFVREKRSERYCREELGVERFAQFADPAFALEPDRSICREFSSKECIGVNVSPLVLSKLGDSAGGFVDQLSQALKLLQDEFGLEVLLVPHVMAYAGPNDDRIALRTLAKRLEALGVRARFAPDELSAVQLKALVGECRAFIGARTHATIAAMSQGVPVVSIGYSVKATGINELVFGDARHVLDYRKLRANEVVSCVRAALAESDSEGLPTQISPSELRANAYEAGQALWEILGSQPKEVADSFPLRQTESERNEGS